MIGNQQGQPFQGAASLHYSDQNRPMERTRPAPRAQVIKLSMVLFTALSVLSFALSRLPW